MTFAANRSLTDQERARHLFQRQRLDVQQADDLSIIRFNATYIEVVDKWFWLRGVVTTFSLAGIFGAIVVWGASFVTFLENQNLSHSDEWVWFGGLAAISAPFLWLMLFFLKSDAFRYTHYPIRLNRKTRMVHVFRFDGTVLSAPWKDLFFCIASLPQNNWAILGHVLNKDGITVDETFAFPVTGVGAADRDQLPRYWEFVRRYMEDGPQSVAKHIEFCLPIASQREGFTDGFHRMHWKSAGAPFPIMIGMLLLYLVSYPGRWLAMRTSKLPVWPAEIEAVCTIDPADPYRKDASTNPPITDHSLIYIVAAIGLGLLAWAWYA